LSLSLSLSLPKPQPPGAIHSLGPTFTENDSTQVVDWTLAASPFACCRSLAQKQRYRVLSDNPVKVF